MLDSDERLLVLRVISHNAVIVRQTNKQVKPRRFCHPEQRSGAEGLLGQNDKLFATASSTVLGMTDRV